MPQNWFATLVYEFVYFSHWPVTKHKSASLLQYDGLCSQEPPSNVSIKRMSILSLTFGDWNIQILYLDISELHYLVALIFPTSNTIHWTLGRFCISDCPFCKIKTLKKHWRINSNRSKLAFCFLPNKTIYLIQKRKRTKSQKEHLFI